MQAARATAQESWTAASWTCHVNPWCHLFPQTQTTHTGSLFSPRVVGRGLPLQMIRGGNRGRSLNCYTKVLPATVMSVWTCGRRDFSPYSNAEILLNWDGRAERWNGAREFSETGQKVCNSTVSKRENMWKYVKRWEPWKYWGKKELDHQRCETDMQMTFLLLGSSLLEGNCREGGNVHIAEK